MARLNRCLLLIALAATVLSCGRTDTCYQIVQSADTDEGVYGFTADLSDSTASYCTSIAARVLSRAIQENKLSRLKLEITVIPPRGEVRCERVNLPLFSDKNTNIVINQGSVDYEWPYRENIRVKARECGLWHIDIKVIEGIESVECLGFSYSPSNGKR